MVKYLAPIFVLFSILVLAGCSSSGSSDKLTESIWILTELDGSALIAETNITAEFDEGGSVSGSTGCNSYNTMYEVDGDKIKFAENFATTMMMCPEPIMEQERLYLAALSNAATFEIIDDELTLYDGEDIPLVVYDAIDQGLGGSSWDVISYNNGKEAVVSVIIGTEITANFGEDNTLTGSAGCNNYTASYETEDENITIVVGATTRKACPEPEGVMEQEQQYLAALETAATYKISGMTMEMRTADGAMVANFQRTLSP